MAILLKSTSGRTTETLELRQLEVKELLQLVLLELKKMNVQLEIINDEEISLC
jgi:hypothetical protein